MHIISLDRDAPEVWNVGPAVTALKAGELVVLPTDSIYAIACNPWDAKAVGRLYAAKGMDPSHRCSVLCGELRDVTTVARAVSNEAFHFMRRHLPGPYTILLNASWELPRRAIGKRKTIGVRIPDHAVAQAVVEGFGQPVLVTSVPAWVEGEDVDPVETARRLFERPAVVLDQGPVRAEPSTVIDFTVDPPELIRLGKGPVDTLAA